MKLKSDFLGTVEAAIKLANKEIGGDALLVNVRQAAIEIRHLGAYQVVFGVTGAAPEAHPGSVRETISEAPADPAVCGRISITSGESVRCDTVSETSGDRVVHRRTFEVPRDRGAGGGPANLAVSSPARVAHRFGPDHPGSAASASGWPAGDRADSRRQRAVQAEGSSRGSGEDYTRWIEAELDPELARLVAQGTPLEDLCLADPTLGAPGALRAVIALVGPRGAGKTTTLAKLAVLYGLAGRKRVLFLSAHVHRIAAAEQLRTLAVILGVGCDIAETPAAVAHGLKEHRLKDLILIDMPGLAQADLEGGRDLARMLVSAQIDIHQVLPVSMKPRDMARAADKFSMFQSHKLIFTRLDETERHGALVSESARSRLPISFLADGQDIPDALEPVTRSRLAALAEPGVHSFPPPRSFPLVAARAARAAA